jgi:hypothetical protein
MFRWVVGNYRLYKRVVMFRWVVGSGSHAAVYPKGKEHRQDVVDQLHRIEGVEVYERHDIPDR